MKQGFTLIELLVVVLIIGILSSIALPQYQKSVAKARASEVLLTTKAILDAGRIYVMANDDCPHSLSDLDIDIPSHTKDWYYSVNGIGYNCAAVVDDSEGIFEAYRLLVTDEEGLPFPKGSTYWTCEGGDCTEFFKTINVKPVDGTRYYQ